MNERGRTLRNAACYEQALERLRNPALPLELFPRPDAEGYFWRSGQRCILPWLRVVRRDPYAANAADAGRLAGAVPWLVVRIDTEPVEWRHETWLEENDEADGSVEQIALRRADGEETVKATWRSRNRYLRADQLLEWMKTLGLLWPGTFRQLLYKSLLLPVSEEQVLHVAALDARIATLRVRVDKRYGAEAPGPGGRSPGVKEPAPDAGRPVGGRLVVLDGHRLPGTIRAWKKGLDPVHTPDSEKSGLTRQLCAGWDIDDDGRLRGGEGAQPVGSVTASNRYWNFNKPKRMMLGANLLARAVELTTSEPTAPDRVRLRAVFSSMRGLTHEDAVVVSCSAAKKLVQRERHVSRVEVPRVCARLEVAPAGPIREGARVVQASIDTFAVGFEGDGTVRMPADGWLQIGLPGAVAPFEGVVRVTRAVSPCSADAREVVEVVLERERALGLGDKLSTGHGIKGVVSAILPDVQMPDGAEIVLSPLGTARRGAIGQFVEAGGEVWDGVSRPCGVIEVMRQPQHAEDKLAVCGAKETGGRGQRYGQMEFWALMAHGAADVAEELLSAGRTRARWIDEEARAASRSMDARQAATSAVNHFLQVVGLEVDGRGLNRLQFYSAAGLGSQLCESSSPLPRELCCPAPSGCTRRRCATARVRARSPDHGASGPQLELGRAVELKGFKWRATKGIRWFDIVDRDWAERLEDPAQFHGPQCVAIDSGTGEEPGPVVLLPPWLRPSTKNTRHELTKAYHRLIRELRRAPQRRRPDRLRSAALWCCRLALDEEHGLGHFLKREVLGRRLTRSGRAVIVPDPTLRVDQVRLPTAIFDTILGGLSEAQRELVLVNRNPVLHRYGLVALRPLRREDGEEVIGLPLALLGGLGADFDGDQVCVVALEGPRAMNEARRLLVPGCDDLRTDPFRTRRPAFRLQNELSALELEWSACTAPTDDWHGVQEQLLRQLLDRSDHGWDEQVAAQIQDHADLWNSGNGLSPDAWTDRAAKEMKDVHDAVARKGQLGGIFRRELYRLRFIDLQTFYGAVAALQAVTERLAQASLKVKGGNAEGLSADVDDLRKVIGDINNQKKPDVLDAEAICRAIGGRYNRVDVRPSLLAWMASPTHDTLQKLATGCGLDVDATLGDPRVGWFLDVSAAVRSSRSRASEDREIT